MKYKVNRDDFDEIEIGELFITENEGEILEFIHVVDTDYDNSISKEDGLVFIFSKGYISKDTNEFTSKIYNQNYHVCYSSDLRGSDDGSIPTIIGRYLTIKNKIHLL